MSVATAITTNPDGNFTPPMGSLTGQQLTIENLDLPPQDSAADANSVSSCGMKNCPYAREIYLPVDEDMKRSQPMPACGDASCPYTKHLLGMY